MSGKGGRLHIVRTVLLVLACAASGTLHAATIENRGTEEERVTVTEGGVRTELAVAPGQAAELCPTGCFVASPTDIMPLKGNELVVVEGGRLRLKRR